jgi:hypothetical protein
MAGNKTIYMEDEKRADVEREVKLSGIGFAYLKLQ